MTLHRAAFLTLVVLAAPLAGCASTEDEAEEMGYDYGNMSCAERAAFYLELAEEGGGEEDKASIGVSDNERNYLLASVAYSNLAVAGEC